MRVVESIPEADTSCIAEFNQIPLCGRACDVTNLIAEDPGMTGEHSTLFMTLQRQAGERRGGCHDRNRNVSLNVPTTRTNIKQIEYWRRRAYINFLALIFGEQNRSWQHLTGCRA